MDMIEDGFVVIDEISGHEPLRLEPLGLP
jgi:hypothetical protein